MYTTCVCTQDAFATMIDVREKSEGIYRRWHSVQPSQKVLAAVAENRRHLIVIGVSFGCIICP